MTETPYHVIRCIHFLQNRLPNRDIRLLKSFRSFITALKFHRYAETPSKNRIYLCIPDPDNEYDPYAIGVHANVERLGFVPRELAAHVGPQFDATDTVMLCYCTGQTTGISSQCIYHIFHMSEVISQTVELEE